VEKTEKKRMIFDRLNELKEIVDTDGNYDDYYKRLSSDE